MLSLTSSRVGRTSGAEKFRSSAKKGFFNSITKLTCHPVQRTSADEGYRKALDVLRTAEQPMTATDIAWAVMAAADVKTDDKKAVQILGQGIQASLRNHAGKGVQQVNEGIPARWELRASPSD